MKKLLVLFLILVFVALTAGPSLADEWKTFKSIPRDWRLISVTSERYNDNAYYRLWFQDKDGNVFLVAPTGGLDWSGELKLIAKIPSK
jgi:hypothetical protein